MKLNDCMNFLLSVSQNKVFKHFSKLLEEYGVTPSQYGVLNCLWAEGELTPKQIGEMLVLEASTISGVLDKMHRLELIDRYVDPQNRRNVLVVATPKSLEIKDGVEEATRQMNRKVLLNLSDQDQAVLKKALNTIIATEWE